MFTKHTINICWWLVISFDTPTVQVSNFDFLLNAHVLNYLNILTVK